MNKRLANWVQTCPDPAGSGTLLLGPKCSLLRLSLPLDAALSHPGSAAILEQAGFIDGLAASSPPVRQTLPAAAKTPRLFNLVLEGPFDQELLSLQRELEARGHAVIVSDQATHRPADVVVFLISAENLDSFADVISAVERAPILWVAECSEGLQIGPVFRTAEDVEQYCLATTQWSAVAKLRNLGFTRLPVTLSKGLRSDVVAIVNAMQHVLDLPPHSCILVEQGREVSMWPATATRGPARPLETLLWSKGIVRNFEVRKSASLTCYGASCLTPCEGDAALECNFGKGLTPEQAAITLIGESLERFCAWQANRRLPHACPAAGERRIPIEDFHPFGDRYEAYLRAPGEIPMLAGEDLVHSERVWVPQALIPFPDLLEDKHPKVSTSNTCGLAAYTSRTGAVLRGAVEILERTNFYRNFVHLRPGIRVDPHELTPEVADLIAELGRERIEVHLVQYTNELRLPHVNAFLLDGESGLVTRGTGTGKSMGQSCLSALLEAILPLPRLSPFDSPEFREAPYEWNRPEIFEELQAYLRQTPFGSIRPVAFDSDEAMLDYLLWNLRASDYSLIAVDLPCHVEGWYVVRMLMPGATCHQHASESAGGRHTKAPVFRHSIPT